MRITSKKNKEKAETIADIYNLPIKATTRNGYHTIDILDAEKPNCLKCDPIIGTAGEINTALSAIARILNNLPENKQFFKWKDKNGNTYILAIDHKRRCFEYPANNYSFSDMYDAYKITRRDIGFMVNDLISAGYKREVF